MKTCCSLGGVMCLHWSKFTHGLTSLDTLHTRWKCSCLFIILCSGGLSVHKGLLGLKDELIRMCWSNVTVTWQSVSSAINPELYPDWTLQDLCLLRKNSVSSELERVWRVQLFETRCIHPMFVWLSACHTMKLTSLYSLKKKQAIIRKHLHEWSLESWLCIW